MFLIDKYVPYVSQKQYDKYSIINNAYFHKDIIKMLENMSKDESIPHLIFYGPEGSGKKTIIRLFLEMLFNKEVHKTQDTKYTVISSGNKSNEVIVKQSSFHIVIEPNNTNFDRYLIQDIVKEYAKWTPLDIFGVKRDFKIVLINNLDNLSYYAQTSLRRTMEKYSSTCRFIMWCRSLSRVIEPLRSRCTCKAIVAPSYEEMFKYLYIINTKERMNISLADLVTICDNSNLNIKKGLWLLQLLKSKHKLETIYDETIENIIDCLVKKDLNDNANIRNLIYNILITNIDGSKLIRDIVIAISKRTDKILSDDKKFQILKSSTKFEHNLLRGRHDIMHLEGFMMDIIYILSN